MQLFRTAVKGEKFYTNTVRKESKGQKRMRECILIFNFEQAAARKLVAQLTIMKFKVRIIKEEDWQYPVGFLCGNSDFKGEDTPKKQEGTLTLDAPMLVMAGVDSNRLNQVLTAVKKAGIGRIPYKAVVTETNQSWLPGALLEELKQEHLKMQNI